MEQLKEVFQSSTVETITTLGVNNSEPKAIQHMQQEVDQDMHYLVVVHMTKVSGTGVIGKMVTGIIRALIRFKQHQTISPALPVIDTKS